VLILFDHGTPKGLIRALPGHAIHTAQSRGWDTLSNGALLNAAEDAGFELVLTTARHIRYQQNLQVRRIALVVLVPPGGRSFGNTPSASLPSLLPRRLAATQRSRFPSSRSHGPGSIHVRGLPYGRPQVVESMRRVSGEPHFRELEPARRLAATIEGLRRAA